VSGINEVKKFRTKNFAGRKSSKKHPSTPMIFQARAAAPSREMKMLRNE
jgi:hypothetical protein